MRKVLSVILSLVMILSVGAMSVSAFAADVASPGKEDTQDKITGVTVTVNGKTTKDITVDRDGNSRVITFTYDGDGKLIGWEFPGMTEGKDYKIIEQKDNYITIEVSEDYEGEVIANAIVEDEEEEEEEETTKKTSKNKSGTSPKTGASVAAGIAAMGAGAAILTALKKKEDE